MSRGNAVCRRQVLMGKTSCYTESSAEIADYEFFIGGLSHAF